MKKNISYVFFYKSLKTCVLCFCLFFNVFCAFSCHVFVVVENKKNVQNYTYDAFLMGKDSIISWTERMFCSIIIDFI